MKETERNALMMAEPPRPMRAPPGLTARTEDERTRQLMAQRGHFVGPPAGVPTSIPQHMYQSGAPLQVRPNEPEPHPFRMSVMTPRGELERMQHGMAQEEFGKQADEMTRRHEILVALLSRLAEPVDHTTPVPKHLSGGLRHGPGTLDREAIMNDANNRLAQRKAPGS